MVEARGYLYDLFHEMYSNRDLRKTAWMEIGNAMRITEKQDQVKYAYLRDQYTKRKHEVVSSGSGRKRKTKDYGIEKEFLRRMSFLSGFVKTKRK
ncbi:unnamed protein product [Allacma fusca]|uniref:MADF domain-containing protein n=1 Tax=Allacma fusca TaxID=39272 RepID=A0A8J2NW78_9HEXA|nr:unnamed protein product [Allacma fusca]